MRLQRYITEDEGMMERGGYKTPPRTSSIEEDEFYSRLKDYSDIIKYYEGGGNLFMRGLHELNTKFGYIQPDKSVRRSAFTSNYYTLITSEDPTWKGIPPRNRSMVGSTDKNKAEGYGDWFAVVLPKNGSELAQCQSIDFWGTFKHAFGNDDYPLDGFNSSLSDLFLNVGASKLPPKKENDDDDFSFMMRQMPDNPDKSIEELKKACDIVDEWYKKDKDKLLGAIQNNTTREFRSAFKLFKGDTYQWLLDVFDPKAAGIKVVKSGETLKKGVETWTNGTCMVVDYYWFMKNQVLVYDKI